MIEFLIVVVNAVIIAMFCWLFFYLGRLCEFRSISLILDEVLDREMEELKCLEEEFRKAKGGVE